MIVRNYLEAQRSLQGKVEFVTLKLFHVQKNLYPRTAKMAHLPAANAVHLQDQELQVLICQNVNTRG